MGAAELCNQLVSFMKEETDLLERMASLELTLKKQVISHDWVALEHTRTKMAPYFRKLAKVEQQRDETFRALSTAVGADETAGVYEVLLHLDREQRDEAADTYRAMKFTVLKIQGITTSIDVYLSTVTEAMQEMLAELFPFRKGNIYTSRGTTSAAKENPMVVNRHL